MSAHTSIYFRHKTKQDTIIHPSNGQSIYLFYDAVHLIKNIRNNLLSFKEFYDDIHVPEGTISWKLLYDVFDKDQVLINTNLRKAPKVSYKTLHPGDNKQNVQLALNIFHETTSAAIASYFPENKSAPAFLKLINIWWKIVNAKQRFNSNFRLGDAATHGDQKPQFLIYKEICWLDSTMASVSNCTVSLESNCKCFSYNLALHCITY